MALRPASGPSQEEILGIPVWGVTFSPDGKTLASRGADADYEVVLWDVATQQPLGEPLRGHEGVVRSLAFSPVSPLLASGGDDGQVVLWDVATGQPHREILMGEGEPVYGLGFSPDGQVLASSYADGMIILWDVSTGQRLGQPLKGHDGAVWSVAFSCDGQLLASSGADGTLALWAVGLERSREVACRVAGRNLSRAEWERFMPGQEYRATCPNLPVEEERGVGSKA